MEKQAKPKSKILKYLPKTTSVSFQNPHFSPGRDHHQNHYGKFKSNAAGAGKSFSGPIVSLIPNEIRIRKHNNYEVITQEPTSPKISCMGQIKHKKKIPNRDKIAKQDPHRHHQQHADNINPTISSSPSTVEKKKKKNQVSKIKSLFRISSSIGRGERTNSKKSDKSGKPKPRIGSVDFDQDSRSSFDQRSVASYDQPRPSLGLMKRFASGRDTLAGFDWTTQIAPEELTDERNYYSDDERARVRVRGENRYEDEEEEEEEEEHIIPFSAPMAIRGVALQPRKEINIWSRRTMEKPEPLKLK